jgi:hypothetical protein
MMHVAPDQSVGDQIQRLTAHRRSYESIKRLLPSEIEDMKNAIRGLLISSGVDRSTLVPGSPVEKHIDRLARLFEKVYPLLFFAYPSAIKVINPRSKLFLANSLNKIFERLTPFASPEELADLAASAATKILSNPKYHQGLDAHEIAEVAEKAVKFGLVRLSSGQQFTDDLIDTIAIVAPVREEALRRGGQFSIESALSLANQVAQQFPSASLRDIAVEIRRRFELDAAGGEYRSLTLDPQAASYIRQSGVPVEKLEKQHEELKENAVNSYMGSAIGAIAKAVRTGMVSPNSPAGRIYQNIQAGGIPPMVYPFHAYQVLVSSGVAPGVASIMLSSPEENSHWLTPNDVQAIRRMQMQVDWMPRFQAIAASFPGNDPQSSAVREAMLSKVVADGGYKNIYHFLALHGPVLQSMPQIREVVTRSAVNKMELAGYDNASWGGPARGMAALQDIGSGKREQKFSVGDLASTVFQFYRQPKGLDMNLGLATPTPDTEIKPIDVMERRDSISIREDSMP